MAATAKNLVKEAEEQKTMPLTATVEVNPIQTPAGGWKLRRAVQQAPAAGVAEPTRGGATGSGPMLLDIVQRKLKSNLNKITMVRFNKIADQILEIAAQSKDETDGRTLRQVIQLTLEKAMDEAHWAFMYAKLCKRIVDTIDPNIKDEGILDRNGNAVAGSNLVRKYLLNRCQEEFERGWNEKPPAKPRGEREDATTKKAAVMCDESYNATVAKRRRLGIVQFVGELYLLGMITWRIMHECVKKFIEYVDMADEAEAETLTRLFKNIGGKLDSAERGKPAMDFYFKRVQIMIDTPELPSRLKFMLMHIVDLRKAGWKSKKDNEGPKTFDEITEKAAFAQANDVLLKKRLLVASVARLGEPTDSVVGKIDIRGNKNLNEEGSGSDKPQEGNPSASLTLSENIFTSIPHSSNNSYSDSDDGHYYGDYSNSSPPRDFAACSLLTNFFNFPTEIRLQIYEELLVLSEPITFETTWDSSCPPLILSKRYGLCPSLLRANKRMQREASPLLYSGNRFGFADLNTPPSLHPNSAVLASFLSQIGCQMASFLRHICIDFPAFDDYRSGSATLQKDSIKTLELIRDNCTSIATLETLLRNTSPLEYADCGLDSSPIAAEALELLDARFKAISSLNEVIVHVYDYEDPSVDLRKKMRDSGWTIKVTRLEESEYAPEEDEYADYESYLEMKREQEMEDEVWEEEYYRRRRDPYWKNDSDYD